MLVPLQPVGLAIVPSNVTVLDPWVDPKFEPVIVTEVPTAPWVGERLPMRGLDDHAFSATGLAQRCRRSKGCSGCCIQL